MKKFLRIGIVALLLLTGCGLIPKRVELGQDKVERVPVAKASEREVQRQTAQRAAQKADSTLRAAILEDASPVVTVPAAETVVLSAAVAQSLGPPVAPANPSTSSASLARKLDSSVASLSRRMDDFRSDNDANAGKRIEDTGLIKVPYVVWLGGALVLFSIVVVVVGIGWTALKVYAVSNPPIALGLKAVSAGGAFASRAVGQLVDGGEKFKGWLKTELPGVSDEVKTKVEDLFRSAHKESSDQSVQSVVKELIQK